MPRFMGQLCGRVGRNVPGVAIFTARVALRGDFDRARRVQ